MYIKTFTIKNFKALKNLTIHFNSTLNVLTGRNNSGKTTVLEALSLWNECFCKLIGQAKRGEKNYQKGDFILGPSYNRYFPFQEINSVRSPNFEDIFHQRDRKNKITLTACFFDELHGDIEISFIIGNSGNNYVIELDGHKVFNYTQFNKFFRGLPDAVSLVYGTPLAHILSEEKFTTDPVIKDSILLRKSVETFRNRLYRILHSENSDFTSNINYILFDNMQIITLFPKTNINNDINAIITYKVGEKDIEKDIALLGSGSLHVIEILLSLHNPASIRSDLQLVLLDEPDSHIHRDIHRRLIQVLNRSTKQKQIVITTHNESLIRSTMPENLFHLEGKATGDIQPIHIEKDREHLGLHFKGIMPSNVTPILRGIGDISGLDFINAIEADKLIFVEGEDDARCFRLLLNQQINNKTRYMFWVLGGVGEIFENIQAYKKVFTQIKNGGSLWDKSVLIFDKDELSNDHKDLLADTFRQKLGIPSYCCNSYTFESTLFTDLTRTSKLLCKFIQKSTNTTVEDATILAKLISEYEAVGESLKQKHTDSFIKDCYWRYKTKNDRTPKLFDQNKSLFNMNGPDLMLYIQNYLNTCIQNKEYYKLMNKDDLESVIQKVVEQFDINFSVETDFIELIKLVDHSTWLREWDFLNSIR